VVRRGDEGREPLAAVRGLEVVDEPLRPRRRVGRVTAARVLDVVELEMGQAVAVAWFKISISEKFLPLLKSLNFSDFGFQFGQMTEIFSKNSSKN
jgi:hypothetical protein